MYIPLLLNTKLALFRPCCCKILYTYILNSYNGIDNFPLGNNQLNSKIHNKYIYLSLQFYLLILKVDPIEIIFKNHPPKKVVIHDLPDPPTHVCF